MPTRKRNPAGFLQQGQKKGTGVNAIGRAWGCSGAYVSTFLKKAGLRPLPGGGYDLAEATEARSRLTIVGKGQLTRNQRPPSNEVRTCRQCGALYTPQGALEEKHAADDAESFCTPECQDDSEGGVSPADTIAKIQAAHIAAGFPRADFADPDLYLNFWTHYRGPESPAELEWARFVTNA